MSASFALAGALIVVALALALNALGLLHLAQAKVNTMQLVDDIKALLAEFEAFDFHALAQRAEHDMAAAVTAAESAVESELQPLHDRLAAVLANMKAALNPPVPVEPEQPAESPAA